MQVVSDTHVRADRNHLFTRHFQMALEDIAASSPNSSSRIGKSRIWTWTNESRSEAGRRDSEWGLSLMS